MPTTQISLIRLHTEKIKPPRALWVPFELGRPLGVPNDPVFQRRVLLAVLKLLEAGEGPLLVDFTEGAPVSGQEPVMLACPYIPKEADTTIISETERLCRAFKIEITSMRPWYDMAVEKRRSTTVGVSQLDLEHLGDFICSFLSEGNPENPRQDVPLAYELRYAADDLKAYYNEALTAQPGVEATTSEALARWFWHDTVAGKVLLAVRDACARSPDDALQRVARRQIVPRKFAS